MLGIFSYQMSASLENCETSCQSASATSSWAQAQSTYHTNDEDLRCHDPSTLCVGPGHRFARFDLWHGGPPILSLFQPRRVTSRRNGYRAHKKQQRRQRQQHLESWTDVITLTGGTRLEGKAAILGLHSAKTTAPVQNPNAGPISKTKRACG
jgi:hypothetical protein